MCDYGLFFVVVYLMAIVCENLVGAISSLLDSRTLQKLPLKTPCKLSFYRLSDDYVEVNVTKLNSEDLQLEMARIRGYSKNKTEKEKIGHDRIEADIENKNRSMVRSKQSVEKRIIKMGADRMLTLTFQENICDIDKANIALKTMLASLRKIKKGFQYVVVPERQKRGAIHYHFALERFFAWNDLLIMWRKCITKAGIKGSGGIHINKKFKNKHRKGDQRNLVALAKYLAKYIGKEVDGEQEIFTKGKKRYYASKFIENKKEIVYSCYCWVMYEYEIMRVILQTLFLAFKQSFYVYKEFKYMSWCWQHAKKYIFLSSKKHISIESQVANYYPKTLFVSDF